MSGTALPFVSDPDFTLYVGDVRHVLAQLPDESVDCCVTSPPYWGLRDYGHEDQIGLEATPAGFVDSMVAVFAEVRRVLKPTGTLWLNLGDTYCHDLKWGGKSGNKNEEQVGYPRPRQRRESGVKPKDLVGVPWTVALALREDGWYLRSDIVWHKPNAMPESVTDRPTKAHEYVFLLTKSQTYFYDADAIRESWADWRQGDPYPNGNRPEQGKYRDVRGDRGITQAPKRGLTGGAYAPPGQEPHEKARRSGNKERKPNPAAVLGSGDTAHGIPWEDDGRGRNARTVWSITTAGYPEAHFATFPLDLPRRCIAAGCPAGGVVLDPFMGSGTTALAARGLGRKAIGVELNQEYAELCSRRLSQLSLLAEAS